MESIFDDLILFSTTIFAGEETSSFIGVILLASVKYFIGVVTALVKGFSLGEILLTAGLGGIVSTVGYTYFGHELRVWLEKNIRFFSRPKSFTYRRRIVKLWKRYGLLGVALLIPILSPQISIGVAISFRERPMRIILYIAGSIIFWILVCFLLKESLIDLMGEKVG